MNRLEVLPSGSRGHAGYDHIHWPTGATATDVLTSLTWHLDGYSRASTAARDFLRMAASAYIADCRLPKPAVGLHRDIALAVQLEDASSWTPTIVGSLGELLNWMSGDSWSIEVFQTRRVGSQVAQLPASRVQLLSGGLDSLCGAVVGLRDDVPIEFLAHRDTANAVRHAQSQINSAINGDAAYTREDLYLRDPRARRNHGPRSRALMFMALGVLAAENAGATELWVPENGFTSINPPLDPGRGGALTTRSTHPYTFYRLGKLLLALGIDVAVVNPFATLTKGEVVAKAGKELLSSKWHDAVRDSFSCGVGNMQFFGGSPNWNCGACVACVVRRGAFAAGGVKDPTVYAINELSGQALKDLIEARARDIISIEDAVQNGIDEAAVLAAGGWPPGTDFDAVMAIVEKGLEEISAIHLPSP